MNNVEKHINLLGLKVKDKVTGFKGIVTSVCFDLYGCKQVIINPKAKKDGTLDNGAWFDSNRLIILNKEHVMSIPDFNIGVEKAIKENIKGPAYKPIK